VNQVLKDVLHVAAEELDVFYRQEYEGDHPYMVKRLADAMGDNPARQAIAILEAYPILVPESKKRTKETSPRMSSLAAKHMKHPDPEIRSMAASLLSQDLTKGQ
jgi:hypothetical protein